MNADGQETNAQCEHDAERDWINVFHSRVIGITANMASVMWSDPESPPRCGGSTHGSAVGFPGIAHFILHFALCILHFSSHSHRNRNPQHLGDAPRLGGAAHRAMRSIAIKDLGDLADRAFIVHVCHQRREPFFHLGN